MRLNKSVVGADDFEAHFHNITQSILKKLLKNEQ